MRNAGMRVVRTWAFNDVTSCSGIHFQCWSGSTATINTGANGLQRLDAVVRAAEAAGIRLILPFGIISPESVFSSIFAADIRNS
jgi:mannan endo-1,4-beta-mannosidase